MHNEKPLYPGAGLLRSTFETAVTGPHYVLFTAAEPPGDQHVINSEKAKKSLTLFLSFFFSKHQSGTIWCNGEPPATTIGAKNEELEKSSEILCLVHASHSSSQEVRAQGHARRRWAS